MKNKKMSKKIQEVAIYARVSTKDQKHGYGVRHQIDRGLYECLLLGHYEPVIYQEANSGSNKKRPKLKKLMKDAKNGKIDLLIVYNTDRLSRNRKDMIVIMDKLLSYGVSIKSLTQCFNTAVGIKASFLSMLGYLAELEVRLIKETTEAGRKHKAERGGYASGRPPMGYKAVNGQLKKVPREVKIVKTIFDMTNDGKTMAKIADHLNAKGTPTKRGGEWWPSTVNNILKNPKYKGIAKQTIGGKTFKLKNPDWKIL